MSRQGPVEDGNRRTRSGEGEIQKRERIQGEATGIEGHLRDDIET